KIGKRGKAQSLVEGFDRAKNDIFVMIDADLQYPPEAIPLMLEKIEKGADLVVAKRNQYKTSKIRSFVSNSFRALFAKVLFGMNYDVQAGLKAFKKEVYAVAQFTPTAGWAFDLEFLHRATQAGFKIENHDIVFEKRLNGKSKISFVQASLEIGANALAVRLKPIYPLHIPPEEKGSMRGAGIGFKRKKYITHTTLHHSHSAIRTFLATQKVFILSLLTIFLIGLVLRPLLALGILIAVLSFIYFLDVVFNLYLILKSLHFPQEISSTEEELKNIKETDLPIYSILCPLYKEAHVIPHFLKSISKLDYPQDKLDVMLLLEEDDKASIEAVKQMDLPKYVRMVVVPHSMPKTKPKACNYGLSHAKGDYLVIYDAEDMPDPQQLKKAYLAFQKVNKNVICLQAKLNYYNPHQNLLTRFFTAEYSLWFDVTLTGLQSINTSLPLGGTSNHFRTNDLKKLEGWDPFNVTEDADLGIRLFKRGYQTAMIDSTTLEEANSRLGNWVRQRSRWIKGYMQTYLVHTREQFGFKHTKGFHSLIFHLTIGGKIAFILINPILWLATIAYFTMYAIVGPTIESLYPSIIFYMAASSLVFGNFLFLYYYMVGLAKREQWNLVKFVFLVPLYWIAISWAGFIALYQLILKPHYWEKTIHGLHLNKKQNKILA
ncbi:MAG TPA: glycosyltransferase, partial [Patescibacteria group bacterium]